ncbi:MAG TPA: aspartate aminotransferase family protein [Bacteroidales bacterium]|nr:aspartate aminotransferase family protein [Bacteroidales bacterium]HPS17511.1 aspartate aminotransferase family protein [Bacteroidales bacterium]
MTQRELFFRHLAQTSESPLAIEIEKAEGIYLYDKDGKKYIDLISGISVSGTGHRHPAVIKAINEQLEKYLHLMVYGEYIQAPQVQLAKKLSEILPESLSSVYFVNSGSEAIEGALKLAKRFTGKGEIIAFKNAYHGSSHGSLSVMGCEDFKQAYRPLLPDVRFIEFNNIKDLECISQKTACVLAETIQGEAGVIIPDNKFMKELRRKCTETGTLLILDEVQAGMGRTGKMFAFEHYGIIPDILTLAKSLGGGMPLGAFISSQEIMKSLTNNPILGHITTFGGHPVSCAAALANLNLILDEKLYIKAKQKSELFLKLLKHPKIKEVRAKGLLIAVELADAKTNQKAISKCIKNGVIADWFLFAPHCMRIAPPLIISDEEIKFACEIILKTLI